MPPESFMSQAALSALQQNAPPKLPPEMRNQIYKHVLKRVDGLQRVTTFSHLELDRTNNTVTRIQDEAREVNFLNDVKPYGYPEIFKMRLSQVEPLFAEFLSHESERMVFQFRHPKVMEDFAAFVRCAVRPDGSFPALIRLVLKWFDDSDVPVVAPEKTAEQQREGTEDLVSGESGEMMEMDELSDQMQGVVTEGTGQDANTTAVGDDGEEGGEAKGEEDFDILTGLFGDDKDAEGEEEEEDSDEDDIEFSDEEEEPVKFPTLKNPESHYAHGYAEKAREHVKAWVQAIMQLPDVVEIEIRIELCQIWKDFMHLQDDTQPLRAREKCTIVVDADFQRWEQINDVNLLLAYSAAALTGQTIEKQSSITGGEVTSMVKSGCRGLRLPPSMTRP